MDDETLTALLIDLESDRVERKASDADRDRICESICAMANDLPNHGLAGVVFIGVRDDGTCADLAVTDAMLLRLADLRSNGNIYPFPAMTVQKRRLCDFELIVIVIEPSDTPPVRFRGRTFVRIGPRRAVATWEEEQRLSEKRRARNVPFDARPVPGASLDDLDIGRFEKEYLPRAVSPEMLSENSRRVEARLASLRMAALDGTPTVTGLLVAGKEPRDLIAGAYVQFLRIAGETLSDPIKDEKEISGPIVDLLRQIDEILRINISVGVDIRSAPTELRAPDYPLPALQQVVRNAILHRNYETSNAPVRIYWFDDRIECFSPGGPFGQVNRGNFGAPGVTDYRNPHLAEAMRVLGYVQRFGAGIPTARRELADNGNPEIEFVPEDSFVAAIVKARR